MRFLILMFVFTAALSGQTQELDHQGPDRQRREIEVDRWCEGKWSDLSIYLDQAQRQFWRGDYVGAKLTLIQGLEENLQDQDFFRQSFTMIAIDRALTTARKLAFEVERGPYGEKSIAHFLFSQYSFIREVGRELDRPFYRGQRLFRFGQLHLEHEQRLIRFALKQIQLTMESFLDQDCRDGYVSTIGDGRGLLIALEEALRYAHEDLMDSLYRDRQSLLMKKIAHLLERIARYNRGGGGFFCIEEAINFAYEQLRRLN